MRAMILEKNQPIAQKPLRWIQAKRPAPDVRELLIRVQFCGADRLDLQIAEGEVASPRSPLIAGHSLVGKVEAVGSSSSRPSKFKIGDIVAAGLLASACGECAYCQTGQEGLCERAQLRGVHVDGGFAEQVVAAEDYCFPVPSSLTPKKLAPLLAPGALAIRALEKAGVSPNGTLGIFGFGNIGHIALQIAREKAVATCVVTRDERRRKLAKNLGAVSAVGSHLELPRKLDAILMLTPSLEAIPAALFSLRRGGNLILVNAAGGNLPDLNFKKHLEHERNIRVVTSHSRKDLATLLALAPKLESHATVYPLEKANEALSSIKEGGPQPAALLEI